MGAYIVRRVLQIVPVVLLVTIFVFLMLHLSGDPITLLSGGGEALDQQQIAALRARYNLDRPLVMQYFLWLGKVFHGDLGTSIVTQQPVTYELKYRIPVTLELGFFAWLFSLVIAIPAGVLSATRRGSVADATATVLTIGGLAIPGFWLGIMLIFLFSVHWRLLPVFGFVSIFHNPIEGIKSQILPIIALGLGAAALNMRQMRSAMLEVLAQDYIRTARAKGLRERSVIWRHAFKNSVLPVVTIMGLQVGRIIGGAVVVENIFAISGVGRLMVQSILNRDFPVVQAIVLLVSIAVLLSNLLTDLLYAYIDPRIRYT
jgi:peptide/nickel transport system permease protein